MSSPDSDLQSTSSLFSENVLQCHLELLGINKPRHGTDDASLAPIIASSALRRLQDYPSTQDPTESLQFGLLAASKFRKESHFAERLTVVDLSCPCISPETACSLFNICLGIFLEQDTDVGRVFALDEAHKSMNSSPEATVLTDTILSAVRLQHHLGVRVIVSTQEPTISKALLNLCSVTIVHHFTSPEWLQILRHYLAAAAKPTVTSEGKTISSQTCSSGENGTAATLFDKNFHLRVGEGLLFAPSAIIGVSSDDDDDRLVVSRLGGDNLAITIRGRLTADGASTQQCETSSTTDPETGEKILRLSSPDQLSVFEGCTTITGHIIIESTYSGDFILNGVTEFAGNIWTEGGADSPAQTLGLVELRDLVELGDIALYGLVDNVYIPNLEHAGDVVLVQASSSAEVDIGSLVEANNVRIRGSWTSINVESLKTVNQVAQFCGSQDCEIFTDQEFPYIVVDLPSLETTNHLELAGTVKSASLPELQVVGFQEPYPDNTQGLRINIQEGGLTLDFDAPKLHTLNGTLELYGGVSGLSLGALDEGNVGITLNARAPLDVYSTIQTARHFYLWGTLHSIDLPNFDGGHLPDLALISLAYEPRLPCNETLYRLWEWAIEYQGSYDPNLCERPDVPDEDEDEDDDENSNDDTSNDDTSNNEDTNDTATPPPSSSNNQDTSADTDDDVNDDESYVPGNGAYQTLRLPSTSGMVLVMVGMSRLAFTIFSDDWLYTGL
ncbi:hypothetical protein BDW59DRAFT_164985 [Aspergillus cavernicola]|uniref:Uncharacterized protein n=1 Tax=Aspergillus cavernicola TaxID=176166 RepID=A0ABR4HY50_9EURO